MPMADPERAVGRISPAVIRAAQPPRAARGPWAYGAAYDADCSYAAMLLVGAGCCALAALITSLLPRWSDPLRAP